MNPYRNAPAERFWRTGVAASTGSAPPNIYRKKWQIAKDDRIATAGSCFAQHIGRHLKALGFGLMDVEPAPKNLPPADHARFGYSIYSARYGNIYTSRQLLQLAEEALLGKPSQEGAWTKGDRYVDALRTAIEPNGLGSPEEVRAHRAQHVARVADLFRTMDVFIFTLGLTECWLNRQSGVALPVVPGAGGAGEFSETYVFRNLTHAEIIDDLKAFRALIKQHNPNPDLRFLFTVSPVPLVATATNKHVLPATIYSKSVLRGVAGQLEQEFSDVDYFPSYEIITNPWSADDFFDTDRRSVTEDGVALAMKTFLSEHAGPDHVSAAPAPAALAETPPPSKSDSAMDVVCEEVLLEAFATHDAP